VVYSGRKADTDVMVILNHPPIPGISKYKKVLNITSEKQASVTTPGFFGYNPIMDQQSFKKRILEEE
jgi:hypothetical protein